MKSIDLNGCTGLEEDKVVLYYAVKYYRLNVGI